MEEVMKNNPAAASTRPPSPLCAGSDPPPLTSVPATAFAGTACVLSVTDRKTGSLITLHLDFVCFTKNIPGRAHFNPLEC